MGDLEYSCQYRGKPADFQFDILAEQIRIPFEKAPEPGDVEVTAFSHIEGNVLRSRSLNSFGESVEGAGGIVGADGVAPGECDAVIRVVFPVGSIYVPDIVHCCPFEPWRGLQGRYRQGGIKL